LFYCLHVIVVGHQSTVTDSEQRRFQ